MIDLHIHTTHSDGTDTLEELLNKANKLGLENISITDHNSVKGYIEMDEKPYLKTLYTGNIIVGCEFTTTYKKQLIEILGYNIDYKKIDAYLSSYYTPEKIREVSNIICDRTITRLLSLGYKCTITEEQYTKFDAESYNVEIYDNLVSHPENKYLLENEGFTSFSNFLRKGLTNPSNKLFIDTSDLRPSVPEIIDVIHEANGLAFLAHPFQYAISNMESFLNELTQNYKFDGIECYYTTFTSEESKFLIEYTTKNNLYVSGGSDYHGTNKENHFLGCGNNNLNISKSIIENWNTTL